MRFFSESIPLPDLASTMYQTLGYGESVNRRDGLSQRPLAAWQRIQCEIAGCWPLENFANVTVLVGVSGGADSVCLLRALHDLFPQNAKGRLVVAHYNHCLRGADSDGDAEFVQEMADRLELEFVLGKSARDDACATENSASEESLRDERYSFFERTAASVGARYLALAHTSNDNVETILHHLFRGTGATGLSGIPMFRNLGPDLVIARPLLNVQRQTIIAGLAELRQGFRHDYTNDTDQWSRNWLRNSLLPSIRQRYPAADEAILRAAELLEQQNADLRQLAQAFIDSSVTSSSTQVVLQSERAGGPDRVGGPGRVGGPDRVGGPGNNNLVPQTVFVAALGLVFDNQQWPRGGIARRHWEGVWQLYCGTSKDSLNLPGNLRASRKADGSVVVERLRSD